MKYTGNLCQGCSAPFEDGDDIVVCPECGTPQHRECYEKENRCVCAHMHADGYTWQGTVKNEPAFSREKKETVSCPNCGYDNPVGTPVCKQCGMKFTLFGMNVVDAMHKEEQKAINPNRDIPDYEAPFTLGEGEAFEKKPEQEAADTAQQVQQKLIDVLTGNAEAGSNEAAPRLNLGGPFPPTDEIDGAMSNNIGNFIGSNALIYIEKFKKMQRGKRISFNFAAFFFGAYWFFYRKLYKAGIVVMTASLALSIIATPYLYKAMEVYEVFGTSVGAAAMTEAQLAEFYNELMAVSVPMTIFFFATLLLQFICGFAANILYKKHVVSHVKAVESMRDKASAMRYIVKNGGASIFIAAAAYFANQLLSMLVSSMM